MCEGGDFTEEETQLAFLELIHSYSSATLDVFLARHGSTS